MAGVIATALKARRDELKIKQPEAARRLGVDVSTVCYWESDRFGPADDKYDTLARFLGWSLQRVLKAIHEDKKSKAKKRAAKRAA